MTPQELQQLQTDYRLIAAQLNAHLAQGLSFRVPVIPANASANELVVHLNMFERNVCEAINTYLAQHLNFDAPLANQQAVMNWVLRADLHLQSLHHLMARHVDWMIQSAADPELRLALTQLRNVTRSGVNLGDAGRGYGVMFEEFRRIIVLHYYRAWVANGLQRELIRSLLDGFSINRRQQLELHIVHLPGITSHETGAIEYAASQADIEPFQRNNIVIPPNTIGPAELNEQLRQNACETQILPEDHYFLSDLRRGIGSGANISFSVPIVGPEIWQYAQNRQLGNFMVLNQDATFERLLSGLLFVRRDRQPGYYPFHILFMHECGHVAHITSRTIIPSAAAHDLFNMNDERHGREWGGTGNGGNPIEEFRVTFFDRASEYNIVTEMRLVPRMPYHCFVVPLANLRAHQGRWNQVIEMRAPLETYMIQNRLLPLRQVADSCVIL